MAVALLLGTVPILALAFALTVVAGRRGWAPTLPQALMVGAVLRVTVAVLAQRGAWQPFDFFHDFPVAGENVLHHRDPLSHTRPYGWNYLPFMAYVFAAQLKLGQLIGLPWVAAGRTVPVIADLVLAGLVGSLARERQALRRFQYACNPLAILVSAVHGQMEPTVLALAVGGLVLARGRRPIMAGALWGLAVAGKSWPLLLLPALLSACRDTRSRVRVTLCGFGTLAVIFLTTPLAVGTPLRQLLADGRQIASYRSATGEWGWTGVAAAVVGPERAGALGSTWAHVGTYMTVLVLAGVFWLWRKADPVDLASAVLLAFLVVTAGFGAQYLLWPVPFLVAKPTRWFPLALGLATTWAATGYLYLTLSAATYRAAHEVWVLASIPVIIALVAAMPRPHRRSPPRSAFSDRDYYGSPAISVPRGEPG